MGVVWGVLPHRVRLGVLSVESKILSGNWQKLIVLQFVSIFHFPMPVGIPG